MAITSGKFIIQAMRRATLTSNIDDKIMFILDDIQEGSMTNEQETIYALGMNGVKIGSADRNKAARAAVKNGSIVAGVMAAQIGSDVRIETVKIRDYKDNHVVASGGVTPTYKPMGPVGAEVTMLYLVNGDGTIGKSFSMNTAASATEFAYNTATNKLTVPTGVSDGARVIVQYDIEVESAVHLTNEEDKFSSEGRLSIECFAKDICSGKSYDALVYFPKAKAEGNFEFSFGSDFSVQDVTFEAMSGGCGSDSTKMLWEFYVYDEADVKTNA